MLHFLNSSVLLVSFHQGEGLPGLPGLSGLAMPGMAWHAWRVLGTREFIIKPNLVFLEGTLGGTLGENQAGCTLY